MSVDKGYRFAVLGDNDADVEVLVAEVRSMAETEIGRQYLRRSTDRHPWTLGDADEVAGRFALNDGRGDQEPLQRGRRRPHHHLGGAGPGPGVLRRVGFRLVIEDRVRDLRSDAEIIELYGPGPDDA